MVCVVNIMYIILLHQTYNMDRLFLKLVQYQAGLLKNRGLTINFKSQESRKSSFSGFRGLVVHTNVATLYSCFVKSLTVVSPADNSAANTA